MADTDPSKYKLNHTMIRIKDPKKTIRFYEILGMKVVHKLEFPDNKFDLYFLGYDESGNISHGNHWTNREGLIELTHNYGTEDDANFKVNTGNDEPNVGFRNFVISVDNIEAVHKNLEAAGHKVLDQPPDIGGVPVAVFPVIVVKDPDGYSVKLLEQADAEKATNEAGTDTGTYRMNRSILRIKDPNKSLPFYQDVLGFELKRSDVMSCPGFTRYIFGYDNPREPPSYSRIDAAEGLLELIWKQGTEEQEDFKYHDGNSEPQGYGHIAISVDDIDAACKRFDDEKVNWKKKLTDGRMKNVAFIYDPDGYWVEIIQNDKYKQAS